MKADSCTGVRVVIGMSMNAVNIGAYSGMTISRLQIMNPQLSLSNLVVGSSICVDYQPKCPSGSVYRIKSYDSIISLKSKFDGLSDASFQVLFNNTQPLIQYWPICIPSETSNLFHEIDNNELNA